MPLPFAMVLTSLSRVRCDYTHSFGRGADPRDSREAPRPRAGQRDLGNQPPLSLVIARIRRVPSAHGVHRSWNRRHRMAPRRHAASRAPCDDECLGAGSRVSTTHAVPPEPQANRHDECSALATNLWLGLPALWAWPADVGRRGRRSTRRRLLAGLGRHCWWAQSYPVPAIPRTEGAGEQANMLRPRAAASADERGAELTPGHRVLEIRARIDLQDELGAKDA